MSKITAAAFWRALGALLLCARPNIVPAPRAICYALSSVLTDRRETQPRKCHPHFRSRPRFGGVSFFVSDAEAFAAEAGRSTIMLVAELRGDLEKAHTCANELSLPFNKTPGLLTRTG